MRGTTRGASAVDKVPDATRTPIVDDNSEAYQMFAEMLSIATYGAKGPTREAGGVPIARDEESNVIFGMSGEVVRLGGASTSSRRARSGG